MVQASRGKVGADDLCHHDPMFLPDGTCLFGQCGAAQTHLANQGVGRGDVFLFFGLFREEKSGEPHHRIFGFVRVAELVELRRCEASERARLAKLAHPHALGMHGANDVIYRGEGRTASRASELLRLTAPGASPSLWRRPSWLRQGELSYHDRPDRWLPGKLLRSVARGQEFVAPIGRRTAPHGWLDSVLAEICDKAGDSWGKSLSTTVNPATEQLRA